MPRQAKLKDSNIAGIGSKEDRSSRKGAARTDRELRGAGTKPGLEIWRVENKRTRKGTPNFGIRRWPSKMHGQFYSGDSYLVLRTYIEPETEHFCWDVHFWLGEDSSQDEVGVAAYKAVEIDDLLDDGPVQHREVQGHESELFQSYFPNMTYMDGGIESGFHHVVPEEYEPRLFQIRRSKKTVRAYQVSVQATSLNEGDVFVLDIGRKVYVWFGELAHPFERSKAGVLAHNIVQSRRGKAVKCDVDRRFWKTLGGTPDDVQPPTADFENRKSADEIERDYRDSGRSGKRTGRKKDILMKLYRLSDASGTMQFEQVGEGNRVPRQLLDEDDAFVLDTTEQVFIWIGKNASRMEKVQGMVYAVRYLNAEDRPKTTPITRIQQGQVNTIFESCFFDAPDIKPPPHTGLSSSGSHHGSSSSRHGRHSKRAHHSHHRSHSRHHRRSHSKRRSERSRHSSKIYYDDAIDNDEVDVSRRTIKPSAIKARESEKKHRSSSGVNSSKRSSSKVRVGNNEYISYKKLLKMKTEDKLDGLDCARMEKYLHPDEFEDIFKMTMKEYKKLPTWKQVNMKKEVKLF